MNYSSDKPASTPPWRRGKIAIVAGEVAGYGQALCQGFRQLGVEADLFFVKWYPFGGTAACRQPFPCSLAQRIHLITQRQSGNNTGVVFALKLLTLLLRFIVLIRVLLSCREIISLGGSSFIGSWEWRVARVLGLRTTVVLMGTESRPHYLGANVVGHASFADPNRIRVSTAKQKASLSRMEKRSDRIVACEVTAHFLSGRYWDFLQVGYPRAEVQQQPKAEHLHHLKEEQHKVVILHAPSNPSAKGTREIREIIRELIEEGCLIEWRELTGVPNSTVLEGLLECDFVVDELWADTPLGGLATEAWLCGKPAVVGGYAQREIAHMAARGAPLDCYVEPGGLKEQIRKLCSDREYRIAQGLKGRRFVEQYYSAAAVANRFLAIFSGNEPAEWLREASDTFYPYGIAFSKDRLALWLQTYISQVGVESLFLDDKPALRSKIASVAESALASDPDLPAGPETVEDTTDTRS